MIGLNLHNLMCKIKLIILSFKFIINLIFKEAVCLSDAQITTDSMTTYSAFCPPGSPVTSVTSYWTPIVCSFQCWVL